jgi:hypothetical protein
MIEPALATAALSRLISLPLPIIGVVSLINICVYLDLISYYLAYSLKNFSFSYNHFYYLTFNGSSIDTFKTCSPKLDL